MVVKRLKREEQTGYKGHSRLTKPAFHPFNMTHTFWMWTERDEENENESVREKRPCKIN